MEILASYISDLDAPAPYDLWMLCPTPLHHVAVSNIQTEIVNFLAPLSSRTRWLDLKSQIAVNGYTEIVRILAPLSE